MLGIIVKSHIFFLYICVDVSVFVCVCDNVFYLLESALESLVEVVGRWRRL